MNKLLTTGKIIHTSYGFFSSVNLRFYSRLLRKCQSGNNSVTLTEHTADATGAAIAKDAARDATIITARRAKPPPVFPFTFTLL